MVSRLRSPFSSSALSASISSLPTRIASLLLTAAALLAAAPQPAHAQSQALTLARPARRITEKVDSGKLTLLPGHVVPAANAANDQGAVDDGEHFGLLMLMLSRTPQQQQDLDALVDQMHNKNSPSYHQWLTPQQFGAHFAPADEDIATVRSWLESQGLTVVEIPPSKTHITITGTVGQLRSAFHADIHHLSVNGEAHMATMTEPSIPSALAPVIAGLHKLDDIHPRPLYSKAGLSKRDLKTGQVTHVSRPSDPVGPDFTTTYSGSTSYNLGPQDFYTVYNENPLLNAGINGAGVTIAVIEETQVNPADVTSFRAGFGLPTYPATPNATNGGVNYIYGATGGVGGDTACTAPETVAAGKTAGDEGEADIDLQWAGAVAPNAIVDFVACGPPLSYTSISSNNLGSSGIDHAAQHIVNYLSSTVTAASLSYGLCESELNATANAYYNNQWQQFAAEGITASVSSGDSGISACNNGSKYVTVNPQVNGLGSSPYNVSAGGTDFSDAYSTDFYTKSSNVWWNAANGTGNSSALSYIPEVAWGGFCSNNLTVSLLAYGGSTTFGTTYTPEAICNNSTANTDGYRASVGGSGGISTIYAAPTWQSVYGTGLYQGSSTFRTLPDVSLFASSGWWSHSLPYCESDDYACTYSNTTDAYYLSAGGTSYVAPQLAGLMALVNQKTKARQGQADYTLYNLAAQEYGTPSTPNTTNLANCSGSGKGAAVGSTCIFYDIAADTPALQTGTNASLFITNGLIASNIVEPCKISGSGSITDCYRTVGTDTYGLTTAPGAASSNYAYFVGAGYDVVTGLGSVNIANLVNNWTTVTPSFATATTLSSTANTVTTTTSVTLTSNVTATGRGGAVSPAGSVTFNLVGSSTALGTGSIASSCTGTGATTSCKGVATFSLPGSALLAGTNNLTATFSGDGANDAVSTSSAITITVPAAASFGTMSFSPASVAYGSAQSVTISDTVTYNGAQPTGAVTFVLHGITYTASCTTTGSPETCSAIVPGSDIAGLSVGSYTVTAALTSDSVYPAATGTSGTFAVLTVPTITWTPSALVGYKGVPVSSGVLDATSTTPGTFAYTATLGVGSPASVTAASTLAPGLYTLTATFTPTDPTTYATQTATVSFTVIYQELFLTNSAGSLSSLYYNGGAESSGVTGGGIGAAVDSTGFVWTIDATGSSVSRFTDTGAFVASYSSLGLSGATALAIDGNSTLWITNGTGSISAISSAGTVLSRTVGSTTTAPTALAIDLSGNVWVANGAASTLDEIIGGAGAVAPLSTAVTSATPAAKP